MQNYLPNYDSPRMQLQISAVQANTKVKVQVPSLKFNEEKTLNADEGITITLPNSVEMNACKKSSATVRIDASADVTVASFNYKLYTADTSVIYPISEWGTEYFVFTPSGTPYGTFKEFSVTNGKESNKVELSLRGTIQFQGNVYQSGSKLVIDLEPYESVQLQSRDDLSGTIVSSQHPVAVFTGHTCTWRFSKCNHVYEQLQPVTKWGTSFIVPPLTFQKKFDSVYVQASQPTKVTVHNGNRKEDFTLNRGETKELHNNNVDTLSILADHGIQVLLLFNGVERSWFQYYDPFLVTIVPTDQFCSSYSLEGHEGFENIALVVAKTSAIATLRLDGANLPGDVQWKSITGTDFSWAEMTYKQTPGKNKRTVSSSGSGFGLYSIGISQMNGYGAPAQCLQPGKVQTLLY